MSRSHLPAGQNLPPQGLPSGMGLPVDNMPGGPPPPAPGPQHYGGPPRRRQQPPPMQQGPPHHHQYPGHQQFAPQYPQHMAPPNMYGGYGMPYGGHQSYYGMPPAPQYQNGGMHAPRGYGMPPNMGYQHYPQSPSAIQNFTPMMGVTVPPNYPRPLSQHSPSLSTPYQPPPLPAPMPPQTPSSTHSSQMMPPQTPPTPQVREPVPTPSAPTSVTSPETFQGTYVSYCPPLPWRSRPDLPWVSKPKKTSRRKQTMAAIQNISLPVEQQEAAAEQNTGAAIETIGLEKLSLETPTTKTSEPAVQSTTKQAVPSADKVVSPTTPNARSRANTAKSATPTKPAVPLVSVGSRPTSSKKNTPQQATASPEKPTVGEKEETVAKTESEAAAAETQATEEKPAPASAPKPTSWANLFAKKQAQAAAANGASPTSSVSGDVPNGNSGVATTTSKNASSVAEAIRAYKVNSGGKASYIEPRGLINTGNMCYMNSILQVLMFCIPFYDLLDQVSKRAAHSFKSETPLIDAMIMFMHEFKVQKSAKSIEQLRNSLRGEDLEKFGEPFTPEFVYEAIRQLPRFASMRRGHQQDAEEFLGFLLQALDEECLHVMGASLSQIASGQSEAGSTDGEANATGDWLEVGRKQKAAVSRSSGNNAPTPINRIFGGLLRSEFRVPGSKDSITTEPYQPLQLDIGAPDVNSVSDALRGLTRTERIHGNFASSRGTESSATKQVFIETLPPVLILHLKRFKFDAEVNGTVKIWKKIDYPLDLEIPREVLSRQTRSTIGNGAMPKYRLISVVYHHGKNASGGHYTVDVRRQDGQDWLRMDDTALRRVRSEDVAESGSEKENKTINDKEAAAASNPVANRFGVIEDEEEDDNNRDEWKEVTASSKQDNKRWSNVVNGTGATATKSKHHKESIKDNKVAYLLFYHRV